MKSYRRAWQSVILGLGVGISVICMLLVSMPLPDRVRAADPVIETSLAGAQQTQTQATAVYRQTDSAQQKALRDLQGTAVQQQIEKDALLLSQTRTAGTATATAAIATRSFQDTVVAAQHAHETETASWQKTSTVAASRTAAAAATTTAEFNATLTVSAQRTLTRAVHKTGTAIVQNTGTAIANAIATETRAAEMAATEKRNADLAIGFGLFVGCMLTLVLGIWLARLAFVVLRKPKLVVVEEVSAPLSSTSATVPEPNTIEHISVEGLSDAELAFESMPFDVSGQRVDENPAIVVDDQGIASAPEHLTKVKIGQDKSDVQFTLDMILQQQREREQEQVNHDDTTSDGNGTADAAAA